MEYASISNEGLSNLLMGISLLIPAIAIWFLIKTREPNVLAILTTLHLLIVVFVPIPSLGLLTTILFFFIPYRKGFEREQNSFDDAFTDE